ncbi:molybdopterin-guanine dinucleotide biosynthesis protein B [Methanofollis formosanus]|uniref:Molybdopterin-guanine dinucleotide biosynthesis protein B n=1 Tax=Methanofollis formosanus TaxID=299308 RepID=A0A8G1A407_9EURY|nr:molybdopterin-guanine dinucleotide biosynthesis protein B [Methanofollis formosanus]QYZ80004.1 molybdopterin-guanine dinucleotide biosynthesis protein B [Methanofollis formosanus]
MKIIQIVGSSNSGKTTFIETLVPALNEHGTVAAVKHLGHDRYAVEEGKDTTKYFEAGAAVSVGIDDEKAVIIRDTPDLTRTLGELCDAGIEYCIIEGFKTVPFPRIVIGDLESTDVALRNPTTAVVLDHLDAFEEFYTMEGIVRELRRSHPLERAGAVLTFNGIVRELTGDERTEYMDFGPEIDAIVEAIRVEAEETPGVIGARFYHRKGRLYAGEDITYFAILAEHRQEAFAAMSRAIDELKSRAHDKNT